MPRAKRTVAAVVTEYGGPEPWSDLHNLALCMAWYKVSASPLGNGTSQAELTFYDHVLIAFLIIYKNLGGIDAAPTRKGRKPYRPRSAKGCKNKWLGMNTEINYFLACDIRASFTVRRSGATLVDFRKDARKFYVEKYRGAFAFEGPYDYLKSKKKWLVDTAQHMRKTQQAGLVAGSGAKPKGGPGNRKKPRLRSEDNGTEDSGEKVPGQKKARRLVKEKIELEAANEVNMSAIAAEVAKFTEKARLHQVSTDTERSKLALEILRHEADVLKEDNRVMGLVLTGMSEDEIEYFTLQKKDAIERQAARRAMKVVQLEEARIAAADAVIAAGVAAEMAPSTVRASPVSVASSDAHDATDRSRARRMVAEAAGLDKVTEEIPEEMVEVSSDDEDGDDVVTSQAEMTQFADDVDVWADACEEDTEEEYDIGLPKDMALPATPVESL